MRTKLLLILWSFGFGMFASLLILLYEIARYNYSPNIWVQFIFIGLLIGCIFLLFNLKEIRSNKLLLILLLASLVIIGGCSREIELTQDDYFSIEFTNTTTYLKGSNHINCEQLIDFIYFTNSNDDFKTWEKERAINGLINLIKLKRCEI